MNKQKLSKLENYFYKRIGNEFKRKRKYLKYRLFTSTKKYDIYKHIGGNGKIVAAYNDVICLESNKTTIILCPNYRNPHFHYKIKLNKKTFPDLIDGSTIDKCLLLPYCRKCSSKNIVDSWRLVIITNKCQIFHNFPSRSSEENLEGVSEFHDIIHFEESAVWDIPGRKYPTNNENVDENEYFFPGFKDDVYLYHPRVNGTTKSKYGNVGFKKYLVSTNGDILSRFYFPKRESASNPFFYLDGIEIDTKITVIGTYRSNTDRCARIVIVATSDGGRNWFAKYEFSDYGDYDFKQGDENVWGLNHGNPINCDGLKLDNEKDLYVQKRSLILNQKDSYLSLGPKIKVLNINNGCPALVTTEEPHNLKNGNIIFLSGTTNNKIASYLLNNDVNDNNPGNSIFYKVVIKSQTEFYLYENVSNVSNSLPCRHIHFVDRARDGWLIGTGETYPNGWVLFMSNKEGDTYSNIDMTVPFPVTQLTFTNESIQRGMGMYLYERENENYFIFASDHDTLNRELIFNHSNSIYRNSTGVYIGKISSIDNYKQTYPIYETNEPCLFFKNIDGDFIFGGQRGELAFGYESGKTWETTRIEKGIKRYSGRTFDFLVIDNYLFVKKI